MTTATNTIDMTTMSPAEREETILASSRVKGRTLTANLHGFLFVLTCQGASRWLVVCYALDGREVYREASTTVGLMTTRLCLAS